MRVLIYRRRFFMALLVIALPLLIVLSVNTGPMKIGLHELWHLLFSDVALSTQEHQWLFIVKDIRMPRVLLGVLVGSCLAVSGAVMQGMFRNPLADPGIIGISSGAALGATLFIVMGSTWLHTTALSQGYFLAIFAFIGGLVTTWILYKMSTNTEGTSVTMMLLSGVAIAALSGAALGLLTYAASDSQLRSLTFWQMGGLGYASWKEVGVALTVLPVLQILMWREAKGLNALLLGDSEARALGIPVQRLKRRLIVLTALGVGVAVSLTGVIGFVGLVTPHIIRLIAGPDHKYLLPASSLLGACLLLMADMLSRILVSPAELPVGLVTAFLGAPFFIYLLYSQREKIT